MAYENYLLNFHKDDLREILSEENVLKHFSININFLVLYENEPDLGSKLLSEDPDGCLSEWDSATLRAQMSLLKEVDRNCELKPNVHCRIYELPAWSYIIRAVFPDKKDVGKFLQISGTVMRTSEAKLLKYEQSFICIKCKAPIKAKAEYERKYLISQPKVCSDGCSGKFFTHVDDDQCKDYQEIKIQERIKDLFGVGAIPNTMLVTLEDDLVDTCKPGDNVTICGVVKMRFGEFKVGCKIDIDITLKANYLSVDNISSAGTVSTPEVKQMIKSFWKNHAENPLLGRDTILSSFCPQLYGLYWVKLAIAIILAGGSPIDDTSTGLRTRAESHLLLVGDPGTGKSQLLKFASKIIPRAVLTTGIGSTAAGLTVSALKEHGEWQLEAGALVMSDGGICCIDEFNSMKEHDRTSIHEAMEQQTISVAKAGIVSKFNTRCSILAACNPKGNIDPNQPLHMSIALPSSLLSRFDLVLMLRDTVNQEWDSLVADFILNGGYNFYKLTNKFWSTEILQNYFAIIKKNHPKLSDDAERILSTYYQMQRRVISRNKARTTVRSLESLIRLSQGHARLMCHESVEIIDSVYAIVLVDTGMEAESSILNLNLNINGVFPEKPLNTYREILQIMSNKLGLPDIFDEELKMLEKFKDKRKRSRFFQKPDRDSERKEKTDSRNEQKLGGRKNTEVVENQVFSKESPETKDDEVKEKNCTKNLREGSSKFTDDPGIENNVKENSVKSASSKEECQMFSKICLKTKDDEFNEPNCTKNLMEESSKSVDQGGLKKKASNNEKSQVFLKKCVETKGDGLKEPNLTQNLIEKSLKPIDDQYAEDTINKGSKKRILNNEQYSSKIKVMKKNSFHSDTDCDEGYDTVTFSKPREASEILTDNGDHEGLSIKEPNEGGSSNSSKEIVVWQNIKICGNPVQQSVPNTSGIQKNIQNTHTQENNKSINEQEPQNSPNKVNEKLNSSAQKLKKIFKKFEFKTRDKTDTKQTDPTGKPIEEPPDTPVKPEPSETKTTAASSKGPQPVKSNLIFQKLDDDFNIDLEFDFDNFKPASGHNSTMISNAKSQNVLPLRPVMTNDKFVTSGLNSTMISNVKCQNVMPPRPVVTNDEFGSSGHNSMIRCRNTELPVKPFVNCDKFLSRKSSSNNSIGSSLIVRCDSNMSFQSDFSQMFEDEDEELDLNI